MRPCLRKLFFCAAAAAIALPAGAWARGGHSGGHGGGHFGGHFGGHPGGHRGFHHFRSSFFFVAPAPFLFAGPPYPYYYYPPGYLQADPPTTYIEKFPGTPMPGMTGIVCPSTGGTYPAVTQCPGGWARAIETR